MEKMDDLLFAASTVLPLLLLMSAGLLSRKAGLLNDGLVKGINQLVFKLFLPLNLCHSIMTTSYDVDIAGTIFWYVPTALAVWVSLLMLIIPHLEKDRKKVGVMIQGCFRANYAFFGIPLVGMLFPGQDTSLAALLVIVTIPVYNLAAVAVLSIYCGGEVRLRKILLNIARNPLIIGSVSGYLLWALRIRLPGFLETTMSNLGKIASPLALFTLGGAMYFASAKAHRRQLFIGLMGKLVISPAMFLSLAVALGFRGVPLACVLVAFGAPTAVASYPMAQQMGGDGALAAEQVAMSSAFSILTTFLMVFLLKTFALI